MKSHLFKRSFTLFLAMSMGLSACAPSAPQQYQIANLDSQGVRNWSEFVDEENVGSYLDGEPQDIEVSKDNIDLLVYRQVTSQNISSERDDRSLLEMDLTNMLATEFPNWTHQQIQEKVNQFGQEYQRRMDSASTGINPHRQNIADQMEMATEIINDITGYVPNPKAFAAKWTMKTISKGVRQWADSPDYDWMAQAQWSASTDSERVRNRQEMIVKEYAENQVKDLRVRQVAYMVHDRRLGTSISYDAKTQFRQNPQALTLQNTEDIKNELGRMAEFLEQHIGPNGSLSVRFDEMEKFLENKFSGLERDIREVGQSVMRVEVKLDRFIDSYHEQTKKNREQAIARFEEQQIEMGKRAAVYLLGNVIGLGNSKAGQRIVTVGNALLDISQAIDQYKISMEAISVGINASAAQMGTTLLMATNIFTAGLAIAGAFGSSGANKRMMKMLARMFRFLEQFRKEMHERFDVIDERLNDIYDTMLAQFHQVFLVLNGIQNDLSEVKVQIRNVMTKLVELENRVMILDSRVQNFSSDYWNYLGESTVSNCIELRQRAPLATISWGEYAKCLGSFVGLATSVAQNSSNTNANLVSGLTGYDDYAARTNLLRAQNFRINPTVLRDLLLAPEYQADGVVLPRVALPQLSIWNSAVKGYLEMLHLWPEYSLAGPEHFRFAPDAQRLLVPVKNSWSFIHALRHPAMIEKLAQVYDQALEKLAKEYAFVHQKEVEKTIDQMTYRGEQVSGAAPIETRYSSAGIPVKVPHCTEPHRYNEIQIPNEFRESVPEALKLHAWLHPHTTKLCYNVETTKVEAAVARREDIQRRSGGGVEGDSYTETIRWTEYQCKVDYEIRLIWTAKINDTELKVQTDLRKATEKSWTLKNKKCVFHLTGPADKLNDPIDEPKTVHNEAGKYIEQIKQLRFMLQNAQEQQITKARQLREDAIALKAVKEASGIFVNSYLGNTEAEPALRRAQQELDYRLEILRSALLLAYPESIKSSEALPGYLFGEKGLKSSYAVGESLQLMNISEAELTHPRIGEEKYEDYFKRRVARVSQVNGPSRVSRAFSNRYIDGERLTNIFKNKFKEFSENETFPFANEVKEIEVLSKQL